MDKKRDWPLALVLSLLIVAMASLSAPAVFADEPTQHVVRWGDTLYTIARLYSVSVDTLAQANKLANPRLIYVGQRLTIPNPAPGSVVHVVAKGETLLAIAARYGVSWWDLVLRNNLGSLNLIYVGQRIVISQPNSTVPHAKPTVPPTQEGILIAAPAANEVITTPITVSGWGSGYENALAVDILDASGTAIGQGFATIQADLGQYGPFSGVITFTQPSTAQLGRIQVYSIAARDGAIEHLASVTVKLKP
jgi:LysM repeat protein